MCAFNFSNFDIHYFCECTSFWFCFVIFNGTDLIKYPVKMVSSSSISKRHPLQNNNKIYPKTYRSPFAANNPGCICTDPDTRVRQRAPPSLHTCVWWMRPQWPTADWRRPRSGVRLEVCVCEKRKEDFVMNGKSTRYEKNLKERCVLVYVCVCCSRVRVYVNVRL